MFFLPHNAGLHPSSDVADQNVVPVHVTKTFVGRGGAHGMLGLGVGRPLLLPSPHAPLSTPHPLANARVRGVVSVHHTTAGVYSPCNTIGKHASLQDPAEKPMEPVQWALPNNGKHQSDVTWSWASAFTRCVSSNELLNLTLSLLVSNGDKATYTPQQQRCE